MQKIISVMDFKVTFLLLAIKIESCFLTNADSTYFESFYQNNTHNLKFSSNFEKDYFLNSFENKKELLSPIDCLKIHSANVFTKSVSYENLDPSRVVCKAYSNYPQFIGDTEMSNNSKIFNIKVSKGKFFYNLLFSNFKSLNNN